MYVNTHLSIFVPTTLFHTQGVIQAWCDEHCDEVKTEQVDGNNRGGGGGIRLVNKDGGWKERGEREREKEEMVGQTWRDGEREKKTAR